MQTHCSVMICPPSVFLIGLCLVFPVIFWNHLSFVLWLLPALVCFPPVWLHALPWLVSPFPSYLFLVYIFSVFPWLFVGLSVFVLGYVLLCSLREVFCSCLFACLPVCLFACLPEFQFFIPSSCKPGFSLLRYTCLCVCLWVHLSFAADQHSWHFHSFNHIIFTHNLRLECVSKSHS